MSQEQIASLEKAQAILEGMAIRDCCCQDYGESVPTELRTACESCQANAAIKSLEDVLVPRIEGLHPNRMMSYPERIFVEEFRKENIPEPGLNGGLTLLENLLTPESAFEKMKNYGFGNRPPVPYISQRDARVATTIIQWLGTNCGRAFVAQCERLIAAEGKGQDKVEGMRGIPVHAAWRDSAPSTDVQSVSQRIAKAYISIDKHPRAVEQLANSIASAIKHFQKDAESSVGPKSVCYDI